jgi:hypothetical protein
VRRGRQRLAGRSSFAELRPEDPTADPSAEPPAARDEG